MKTGKKYTRLMLFEFFHKVVLFSILYPFLLYGLRYVMKATGIKYLTNNYFYKFIFSPEAVMLIVLLLLFYGVGIMFELTCVDIMINLSNDNRKMSLYAICVKGAAGTKKVFRPRNIGIVLYSFLMCICMNIFIMYNSFKSYDFADMAANSISETRGAVWWTAAALVFIFVIVVYGFFTINLFINNNGSFIRCYLRSCRIVKKHFFKILMYIVVFNVCSALIYGLIYVFMSVIVVLGVYLLDIAHMGVAIYLTFVRLFREIISIILLIMSIPVSYISITRIYTKEMEQNKMEYIGYDVSDVEVPAWRKNMINAVVLLSVAVMCMVILNTRTMNVFGDIEILNVTQITSHRGSSRICPENTMAAFNMALEELADCIELDVRQTLDGEFVVMHDLSLRRTTGVKSNVNALTLEEIRQLDAGSWKSQEYEGERVPELSEVLRFARGRVRLNIELKTTDNDIDFAAKLVAMLEEYNMAEDCVVSSFDYEILKEIKALNEDIRTGYIISVAYGDYYSMDYIDFFSVNYAFVNAEMVEKAHDAGKEVAVWTVNSKKLLKQMTEYGVDDIITDNLVLAREVVYSENTSATLIEMLQYVFDR